MTAPNKTAPLCTLPYLSPWVTPAHFGAKIANIFFCRFSGGIHPKNTHIIIVWRNGRAPAQISAWGHLRALRGRAGAIKIGKKELKTIVEKLVLSCFRDTFGCPEIARGRVQTVQKHFWDIYIYILTPINPLMVLSVINNNLYIYSSIIYIVLNLFTRDTVEKKS